MSTTTSAVETTIARYFDAWNETDPVRRRGLLAEALTPDASYLDPVMAGEGHAGIDALIAATQGQAPGHVFRQRGAVECHHDWVRFAWELVGADGSDAGLAGTDVAFVASDGRLRSVTGFLDRVPEGFAAG